jgi:hypothetical protein
MDRRDLLQGGLAAILALCLPTLDLRAAGSSSDPALPEFPAALRQLVTAIADALIPRTDTPGALDVRAGEFAERLLRHTDRATVDAFAAGARAFAAAASRDLGMPFGSATPQARLGYVQRLDAASFSSPPADPAAPGAFLLSLKRLIVIGYYTSDAGAHAELDVELFPGPFQGAVSISTQPKTYYEDSFGVPVERPPGYLRT